MGYELPTIVSISTAKNKRRSMTMSDNKNIGEHVGEGVDKESEKGERKEDKNDMALMLIPKNHMALVLYQ